MEGKAPHSGLMEAASEGVVILNLVLNARIFETVFTTKEVSQGTGLGLSNVYGIIEQSGGDISVQSEPGRGSSFRVYLPLAAIETDAVPGPPSVAKPRAGSHGTILLVEDEDTVRKFIARTLVSAGYTVLEAKDGAVALAAAEGAGPIHLLLTNVVMPNLNGGKLSEKQKVSRPGMQVLFMSGYTNNILHPKGVVDPDARILQKPFSQEITQVSGVIFPREPDNDFLPFPRIQE